MKDAIQKAEGMIEALPYIQKFRGEAVVVKFGGSIMETQSGYHNILQDVAFMEVIGMRPVLVHGGGKAISKTLEQRGIATHFLHGLRITCEDTIHVVEEVLNQQVNQEITRTLDTFQCTGRSIHGEDILQAAKHIGKDGDGVELDWGFVGHVESVDTAPIQAYLDAGIVPVVTPLGRGADGQLYNINADEAASAIACALQSRKLVFLSDVPGLLQNVEDPDSLISTVQSTEVDNLIANGTISGGMLPKLRGALKAIEIGVRKIHIIDASLPHSLLLELFTDKGVGTEIVP